jgi:hypothetical protein
MGGDETLKVDPSVLQSVGTAFGQAGAVIADLQADAPLGDAAGAVPQLRTGNACRKAQSEVAEQLAAVARDVRTYGDNLQTAAYRYLSADATAASAIKKIEIPR